MAEEVKVALVTVELDTKSAQTSLDKLTESIEENKKESKKAKDEMKEMGERTKANSTEWDKQAKIVATNQIKLGKLNKERRASIQTLEAEKNSAIAMKAKLASLGTQRDKQNQSTKKGALEVKRLNDQMLKLTGSLSRSEQAGGRFSRSVGDYGGKMRNLTSALGQATGSIGGFNLALLASPVGLIAGAFGALLAVGRQAFNFFKEYEVIMSKVKATTGATAEEFDKLRESTIAYGESTKFTAREVGQLQLELSKLGFTTDEIVDATGAILDLAVATDSELGNAAKVVASTLNQFGLEAKEAQRITDVMAKSFSSSALDISKFAEGMKNAGPAAEAVGATVEQTTAILATLADANVDASTSGSAVRNMFIDLAAEGITWSDAMGQINTSQNKLATANELFGKRGAVVAKIIAENSDQIDILTQSFIDAEGAAKAMADIVGNNLQGDLDRLGSSWEGLIARGSGLNKAFRVITTTVTFLIDAVKQLGTDVLSLFSVSGLIDLAVKKFGVRIQIFFNDLIIDSFKALQKGAAKLGLSIDSINDTITSNQQLNANLRAKIAEEEAKKGETAYERYRKGLTAIFKEEEDAKTAAKLKANEDQIIADKLAGENSEKLRKEREKKAKKDRELAEEAAEHQKQKTFELELFRKTRDAEEEKDLDLKFEKLKEVERFKRDFLLENAELIETEREIIIEESMQRELDLDAEKNEQKKKNAEKLAKDEKKIDAEKAKAKKKDAKDQEALDKKVARSKLALLNAGFSLATALAGKNEKVQKAIAISQALANTAVGITKAFATYGPTPLGFAGAATVGATGAAQVLNIKNSDNGGNVGGIDTGSGGGGGTPIDTNAGADVDTSNADDQLSGAALLGQALANMNIQVDVKEITDMQNAIEVAEGAVKI